MPNLVSKADRIEPRVARALVLAAKKLQARVPMTRLASAVAARDVRSAAEIIERILPQVEDAYTPSGEILADAFRAGAREAAKSIDSE